MPDQVHEFISARFSPYVFDPRPVEIEKLQSCLEAARWAASSYNEQPWNFIVARRENADEFQRALDCLVEGNRAWAKDAGVLMLTAVCKTFARNGHPNKMAQHDLGLAVGNLTTQATALGLAVHQMAGIVAQKIKLTYGVPDTHEIMTGIAIGYAGDPAQASDSSLAERDQRTRTRKSIDEFVFASSWNHPLTF